MPAKSITSPDFQQYFWSSMKRTPSGCLEWQRFREKRGYGRVRVVEKEQLAHRIAWIIVHGPIQDDLCVLHRCDNPACCEVSHLFLGTRTDNNLDRDAKGHQVPSKGTQHGNAKLSDADIRAMRHAYVAGSFGYGHLTYRHRNGIAGEAVALLVPTHPI
jgi:hypothetical protein